MLFWPLSGVAKLNFFFQWVQEMKPVMVSEKEEEKVKCRKDDSSNVGVEDNEGKGRAEEDKRIEIKGRNTDLQIDLEKPERDGNAATVNKLNQQLPTKATKEEPQAEKYGMSIRCHWFHDLKSILALCSTPLFLRDS